MEWREVRAGYIVSPSALRPSCSPVQIVLAEGAERVISQRGSNEDMVGSTAVRGEA